MNLSDITLLILSHNRQHCLKKTLDFYTKTNLKLLVLDNSPLDLDPRNIPENCRYINVRDSFSVRSGLAAQLIDTPYTIIGADDEIYLPSSLILMRDFLANNDDYVAAGGNAVAVWRYGPIIAATWAYKRTFRYHNQEETPFERIKLHTGDGENPKTSFFTCNLTRTSAIVNCLRMYSEAPVLATDAISVLTICGAGKSKYLDVTYWIRNWNQSPKSHSGWNSRVFLHDWWKQSENEQKRVNFSRALEDLYSKYSADSKFEESWNLILKSDTVLHHKQRFLYGFIKQFAERPLFKSCKYSIKKFLKPHSIPSSSAHVASEMEESGIFVPMNEFSSAVSIVSNLMPYENW